jgi:hypothetical protein
LDRYHTSSRVYCGAKPDEDSSAANQQAASKNVFYPCYHEFLVENKKRSIYWNPQNDMIVFKTLGESLDEVDQDRNLA